MTSEAIGMDQAQNVIKENKAETIWDGSVGQNTASYEKDGSSYEIWVEDAQSIAEKVKLIPKYKLAGVAQWKLCLLYTSVKRLDNNYGLFYSKNCRTVFVEILIYSAII